MHVAGIPGLLAAPGPEGSGQPKARTAGFQSVLQETLRDQAQAAGSSGRTGVARIQQDAEEQPSAIDRELRDGAPVAAVLFGADAVAVLLPAGELPADTGLLFGSVEHTFNTANDTDLALASPGAGEGIADLVSARQLRGPGGQAAWPGEPVALVARSGVLEGSMAVTSETDAVSTLSRSVPEGPVGVDRRSLLAGAAMSEPKVEHTGQGVPSGVSLAGQGAAALSDTVEERFALRDGGTALGRRVGGTSPRLATSGEAGLAGHWVRTGASAQAAKTEAASQAGMVAAPSETFPPGEPSESLAFADLEGNHHAFGDTPVWPEGMTPDAGAAVPRGARGSGSDPTDDAPGAAGFTTVLERGQQRLQEDSHLRTGLGAGAASGYEEAGDSSSRVPARVTGGQPAASDGQLSDEVDSWSGTGAYSVNPSGDGELARWEEETLLRASSAEAGAPGWAAGHAVASTQEPAGGDGGTGMAFSVQPQPLAGPEPGSPDPSVFRGSVTQQLSEHLLELVAEMRQQVTPGGGGRVAIRLHPEYLGEVVLRISVDPSGSVTARFAVENSQVRAWIQEDLPELRAALAEHGLQLADAHVDSGPGHGHSGLLAFGGSTSGWGANHAPSRSTPSELHELGTTPVGEGASLMDGDGRALPPDGIATMIDVVV